MKKRFGSYKEQQAAFANMNSRQPNLKTSNAPPDALNIKSVERTLPLKPDAGIDEIKMLRNEEGFFKSTADSPLWDSLFKKPEYFKKEKGLVAHLEYMKPIDYLKESIRGYDNITLDEHMKFIKKYRSKDYAKMFAKGDLFPIPWFEYYEDGSRDQEGNHRAMALQLLIDEGKIPPDYEMPVIIVKHIQVGD